MSKRLQIVCMDERELREIRRAAGRERLTVSEWARQALRTAGGRISKGDPGKKILAIRAAARHAFPTADIDAMLAEIERGYGAEPGV